MGTDLQPLVKCRDAIASKNNLTISCRRCEVREEETAAATHTWHFPLVSREIRSVLKILSPPSIVLSRKSYYHTVISDSIPCKHQFTIIHSSRIV